MMLERVQLSVARAILKLSRCHYHNMEVLQKIGWPKLSCCRPHFKLLLFWDIIHVGAPPPLPLLARMKFLPLLLPSPEPYSLRNPQTIAFPVFHNDSSLRMKSLLPSVISLFNSLPTSVSSNSSKSSFLRAINSHFSSHQRCGLFYLSPLSNSFSLTPSLWAQGKP